MGISDDIHRRKPQKKVIAPDASDATFVDNSPVSKEDISDIIEPLPETFEPADSKAHDSFFGPKKATKKEQKTNIKKSLALAILLGLLVLTLVAAAIYQNLDLIKHRILKFPETTTSTVTAPSTSTDTPSTTTETQPVAEVTQPVATTPVAPAKDSFTIRVSNGNGVKGSGDKVADILKTAGFNVKSVGNANSYSYKTTIVYYKAGKEAEAALVQAALATRTVSSELSSTLTLYDVLVVVGAK